MKMFAYKLGIAILFALIIELVSSAPSLNKSPKGFSDLVIAASDNISSEEISGSSNNFLNSTHLDSQTNSSTVKAGSNNASSTTKQSAIKSKSFNLTITNTSSVSNFTDNGSQSAAHLIDLLSDFFSGIFDDVSEKSTIHHTSTSSPTTTTSSIRQPHVFRENNRHSSDDDDDDRRSSINPSFHHFFSPSLRVFFPFGRFFRNLLENGPKL